MTITKHAESHVDHNLTEAQLAFVLSHDPSRHGDGRIRVFTVDIPPDLGTLPCALYGPVEGDDPVPESEVIYRFRDGRKGKSRLIEAPKRQTTKVTIVAGPHEDIEWILYTCYGGHAAPREPFELMNDVSEAKRLSNEFWATHALAYTPRPKVKVVKKNNSREFPYRACKMTSRIFLGIYQ